MDNFIVSFVKKKKLNKETRLKTGDLKEDFTYLNK